MKRKSGIFSFRVNAILTSILSALHPFFTLPNNVLKRKRGTFFSVSSDLLKGTKKYLFAVGSDTLKSAKKVPFKKYKIVFSSFCEAIQNPTDWHMSTVGTSWASMNDAQTFFRGFLVILLKLKWSTRGISGAKTFSSLLLAKIKSEKLEEIRKY